MSVTKGNSAKEVCETLKKQFRLKAEMVFGQACVYNTGNSGWNVVIGDNPIPRLAFNSKEEAVESAQKIIARDIKEKRNLPDGVAELFLEAFEDEEDEP